MLTTAIQTAISAMLPRKYCVAGASWSALTAAARQMTAKAAYVDGSLSRLNILSIISV